MPLGTFGATSEADVRFLKARLKLCLDCQHLMSYTINRNVIYCDTRGVIPPPEEPICLSKHKIPGGRKSSEIKKLLQYMERA